jgi:DeoR/GlpR family transcriptional regulator of sugar metabolism
MITSDHKTMRVPDRVVEARRQRLARLLARHHYLPLGEVCARLEVSEPTARRDLAALAADRSITRTRGGALVDYNQKFPSFRERLDQAPEAKRRIAAAAAALLRPGQTVWLDGGTTVYLAAERLAERRPEALVVVTHNMPAAELLAGLDDVEVHLLGGRYFRRTSLLLGDRTVSAARRWRFDVALLGVEGLTPTGMWNSLADVVQLQRAVLRASARSVVLADASKIGRPAPDFLGPLADVDHILSDAPEAAFRAAGIPLGRGQLLPATSDSDRRFKKGGPQP